MTLFSVDMVMLLGNEWVYRPVALKCTVEVNGNVVSTCSDDGGPSLRRASTSREENSRASQCKRDFRFGDHSLRPMDISV